MDSSPEQPEKKQEERAGVLIAARWLKEQIFAPQEESAISSLSEFLLPVLLGIMEACWLAAILIGLASIGLFSSSEPLMPLWAPFLLIVGSIVLFYFEGLRTAKRASSSQDNESIKDSAAGTSQFIIITSVLALFFTWLHLYANTFFVFDPKWLLALLNDILLLKEHFYEVVLIVGLAFLFGWRGIRLLDHQIEPSNVFRTLCLGLGIMIVVIMLRAGRASTGAVFHDDATLLFLISLFLTISLATHALARITFIRHSHPTGLQGSVVAQERAIIIVIAALSLVFLLIAIVMGSIINPTFLQGLAPLGAAIGKVYSWLVEVIAGLAVLIAAPFFWLVSLFTSLFPPKPKSSAPEGQPPKRPRFPVHTPSAIDMIIPFVRIILPMLFLLLVFLLIWWALRRRRRVRVTAQRKKEDVHESLWSWTLFWSQLRAMLHSLFARLFPHAATTEDDQAILAEQIQGAPAARSMREIYRAFLKKAANHGYSRKRHETPYELKQRIDEKAPLVEPQLEVITEAYALTRYGGSVPNEAQLEFVRNMWVELDQKWV